MRNVRQDRGQSTVEFALVLPVLVAVVFGIVDFARLFHVYAIANGAREGARYCAMHHRLAAGDFGSAHVPTVSATVGTQNRVLQELDGRVTIDASTTTCPDEMIVPAGQPVKVVVRAVFTPVTPIPVSGAITINASASMVRI